MFVRRLTTIIAITLVAGLLVPACSDVETANPLDGSEEVRGRTNEDGPQLLFANVVLRPDGDLIPNNAWWGITPTCIGPHCPKWSTVDDPIDTPDNEYMNACMPNAPHRFSISDLSGPQNLRVKRITFSLGDVKFHVPNSYGDYQALRLQYFINGVEVGSDIYECCGDTGPGGCLDFCIGLCNYDCGFEFLEWTANFTGLNYTLADINTLEVLLTASGALGTADGFLDVGQVEAKVRYLILNEQPAP